MKPTEGPARRIPGWRSFRFLISDVDCRNGPAAVTLGCRARSRPDGIARLSQGQAAPTPRQLAGRPLWGRAAHPGTLALGGDGTGGRAGAATRAYRSLTPIPRAGKGTGDPPDARTDRAFLDAWRKDASLGARVETRPSRHSEMPSQGRLGNTSDPLWTPRESGCSPRFLGKWIPAATRRNEGRRRCSSNSTWTAHPTTMMTTK